jgi:hypothetical protein
MQIFKNFSAPTRATSGRPAYSPALMVRRKKGVADKCKATEWSVDLKKSEQKKTYVATEQYQKWLQENPKFERRENAVSRMGDGREVGKIDGIRSAASIQLQHHEKNGDLVLNLCVSVSSLSARILDRP